MNNKLKAFRNLITKSMNTKQLSKIAFAIMLVFSMVACKKEGPVVRDSVKPHSTLQISGGGFSKTFDSDSDYTYGQLNLKPNTKYNFSLAASDTGGLRLLELQMPNDLVFGTITSVTAYTERTSGLSKIFSVTGTASDPYTSFIISGSFTTQNVQQGEDLGYSIYTGARDYGNLVGAISVSCLVSYSPPYDYGWISIF